MVDSIPFRPEPYHILAVLAVCLCWSFWLRWPGLADLARDPVASLRAV